MLPILPLALLALAPSPARQDTPGATETVQESSVESLARRAVEAHRAGRHQEAIDLFQAAIALIQADEERGLVAFLPAAPEGWQRSEPESTSGAWGAGANGWTWTQVSARYTQVEGEGDVEATISNSPTLTMAYQGMAQMLKNPQYAEMLNQDPTRKIELLDVGEGWTAWKMTQPSETEVLAFSEGLMVQLRSEDPSVLEGLWKDVDFAGLKKGFAKPAGK